MIDELHFSDRHDSAAERLRLALRAAHAGMWHWDMLTDEIEWGEEYYDVYGLAPGSVKPSFENWLSCVHPEDREYAARKTSEAVEQRKELNFEFRIIRPDGALRWIAALGEIFYDNGGRAVRMSGISLDVTARREAEDERQRLLESEQAARRAAEEANRLKDEFLANVSHELRTPLTAIVGWTRLLESKALDHENTARALEVINRNAGALTQLIEDLLDITRILTGKLRLDMRPVEIVPVIEAAIDAVRPAAEARQISLHKELNPQAGLVQGDADRLQQVVWNLLANSVKFTPPGGSVRVSLESLDAHVEITVSDTGEGISADFLPHVFDRFRQADQKSTRPHSGLGLGLSIVHQLTELHGGAVRAFSSGVGQGASFVVTLPLINSEMDGGLRQFPDSDGCRAFDGLPVLEGVRVLAVDDETDTLDLLRMVLEPCGATVVAATSSADALEKLAQAKPNVLITDIGMAGADGYELIRRVRALPEESGGRVPAVALTAYARVEDRVRAIAAGFQIHVPKPVEPAELIAIVASLTGLLPKDEN